MPSSRAMPRPRPVSAPPFRLALVLFPGCLPAGLFAAADLVRACNLREGRERVQVAWVGVAPGPVPTHGGPAVMATEALADARADACLVPGLWLTSTGDLADAVRARQPLVDALRALPRRTQVWSWCVGVALAAAAGRLEARPATATWWLLPALAVRHPRVAWQAGVDLVAAGDVATAPGPAGHLPLMVDRLAGLYPADVLRDAEDLLMLPAPRVRHAAFQRVELLAIEDLALRALLQWARRTPAREVTLAAAARHAHVSVRTLCRRVRQATGLSAGDWLRRAKLGQAAEALRSTRSPVKAIGDRLGFGSEAGLHRAFLSVTGMTPAAWRQAHGVGVRAGGAPVDEA